MTPTSLPEAIRYFADLDVATEFFAKLRWPDGPACPRCGCREHTYLTTRRLWKCKACKKQYSVRIGTVFEGSPLGLDKWLAAVWLMANSEGSVSSRALAKQLGVTQVSAWFMLSRIRRAIGALPTEEQKVLRGWRQLLGVAVWPPEVLNEPAAPSAPKERDS